MKYKPCYNLYVDSACIESREAVLVIRTAEQVEDGAIIGDVDLLRVLPLCLQNILLLAPSTAADCPEFSGSRGVMD